ncbi:hypothetical protein CEXT_379571 [Caerostris extrusa]|uniref:Uncharacterized protein n=1 Tax=Caerostris extrusa TaxID=172846 RepID=A0AAV4VIY9_CAEEX|nr:hypothetical protein CEXT_379571 [Caerostris extrusa]
MRLICQSRYNSPSLEPDKEFVALRLRTGRTPRSEVGSKEKRDFRTAGGDPERKKEPKTKQTSGVNYV